MFDSIIKEAQEKFGLGDKAGSLLASLLGLIVNPENGGFSGFIERFKNAGLGNLAQSWVTTGDNTPISNEQLESALGEDTINSVAEQTGVEKATATSALGLMTPHVVDSLTPDGEIPDEAGLISRITGFLSNYGGAIGGAVLGGLGIGGAFASGAADKVGDAAGATPGAGKAVVGKGAEVVGDAAGATADAGKKAVNAVGDTVGGAMNKVGDVFDGDGDGGGILKWLIPLLLLGLLIVLGYWFCGKSQVPPTPTPTPTPKNANANVNKGNVNANANKGNTNTAAVNVATTDADRKLTEVSLPDGTKLQAYPGGIEDQLIKFIQSDDYKNGTAETLKDKWFNFDDLNFKVGSSELVPESKRQLDNIMVILKAFPAVKLKIGGYTDKTGDDAKNKKLSDDRAKSVKAALEKAGVGAQVPEAEGYGEEQAKVPETAGDDERKADRKTSVRLLK